MHTARPWRFLQVPVPQFWNLHEVMHAPWATLSKIGTSEKKIWKNALDKKSDNGNFLKGTFKQYSKLLSMKIFQSVLF